jgi:small subunit ribosomal protein S21e
VAHFVRYDGGHIQSHGLFCFAFLNLSLSHDYIFFSVPQLQYNLAIMQNENGENVDLYIPRKCSWTNRLIRAKDHGSVQINVANVDPVTGLYTGETTSYCLSGYVRDKSEGDMALTALVEANDKKVVAPLE